MGVPKKRKTKSRTRTRRSHHALARIHLARCRNCGVAVMPHEACRECGMYRTAKSEARNPKSETTIKSQ